MCRICASPAKIIRTTLGDCTKKIVSTTGNSMKAGTPAGMQLERGVNPIPPASTLSFSRFIISLAHGLMLGLVRSATLKVGWAPMRRACQNVLVLFAPGLSHAAEEVEKEGIVPSDAFDFPAHGNARRINTNDVDCERSHDGKILGPLPFLV